jgi:hypothetical protein
MSIKSSIKTSVTKSGSNLVYNTYLTLTIPDGMTQYYWEYLNKNKELTRPEKNITFSIDPPEIIFHRLLTISKDSYIENPQNEVDIQKEFLELLDPLLHKMNNIHNLANFVNNPGTESAQVLSELISKPEEMNYLKKIYDLLVLIGERIDIRKE